MNATAREFRAKSQRRRGLRREEAAAYIGISPTKFGEMVGDGRMPKFKKIDDAAVWDVHLLDSAFDALLQIAWPGTLRSTRCATCSAPVRSRAGTSGPTKRIKQFEDRHPIGSKARLAFAIFRYVGVRRSDAVKLGKVNAFMAQDEAGNADEALRFHITKGSQRKPHPGKPAPEPKWLVVPILPELREILDATPSGHLTYLVTNFGKPFSVAGLGNWFREQCNAAGLPHRSAHDLQSPTEGRDLVDRLVAGLVPSNLQL